MEVEYVFDDGVVGEEFSEGLDHRGVDPNCNNIVVPCRASKDDVGYVVVDHVNAESGVTRVDMIVVEDFVKLCWCLGCLVRG